MGVEDLEFIKSLEHGQTKRQTLFPIHLRTGGDVRSDTYLLSSCFCFVSSFAAVKLESFFQRIVKAIWQHDSEGVKNSRHLFPLPAVGFWPLICVDCLTVDCRRMI